MLSCSQSFQRVWWAGPCFNIKTQSYRHWDSHYIKIRQSHNHVTFIMKIPIYWKMIFILKQGPDNIHHGKKNSGWIQHHLEDENWCVFRVDYRFAPSQWETLLQSNAVSHLLGTNLESALCVGMSCTLDRLCVNQCNDCISCTGI